MKYLFLLISLPFFNLSIGQIPGPHRYTVSVRPGCEVLPSLNLFGGEQAIKRIEPLNRNQSILSIEFNSRFTVLEEQQWLENHSCVLSFQKVYPLSSRGCNPNDSAYLAQYNMELMKFDEVWCYSTSGISTLGDTLVVGAIDNGFSYWLDDLLPNVFINRNEIPDNQIDDDGNGYLDDYYGLNAKAASEGDQHQSDRHGTQVVSVLAAKGNNRLGITGTNQNIKVLLCSASFSDELVKCYHYFVDMKRDYLNSGGAKGAFIVSSNLSAGFEAFPPDLPLVCESYDSLGNVGILSAVATINENEDIAIVGDIPGLCPSLFMIAVTNTDRQDQKVTDAGFNAEHVDLGACGEGIPMLDQFGRVQEESGCSFSSPHLAGAISILYQFCTKLTELNKTNPPASALVLREILLQCGDPLTTLEGITSSGKRLNMLKALTCLNQYCQDSINGGGLSVKNNLGNGPLEISFTPETFGDYKLLIFNNLGQIVTKKSIRYAPDMLTQHIIEINDWSPGIYYIFIEGSGQKWTKRLIKL
ncbi:MAG TPA: S8 family serine peptidase [Saprospiraceae bacterium]|nr:S8 family serine peptidase [Saprospiraceae bacterium]